MGGWEYESCMFNSDCSDSYLTLAPDQHVSLSLRSLYLRKICLVWQDVCIVRFVPRYMSILVARCDIMTRDVGGVEIVKYQDLVQNVRSASPRGMIVCVCIFF